MFGDMTPYTVCFFGHREINDFLHAETKVYEIITELLRTENFVEFLVGRNGEFDQIVSSGVLRTKKKIGGECVSLVLILPYSTAELSKNMETFADYYDSIEIANEAKTHYKSAFQKRNRQMVNRSDLCVFYVEHPFGGAYQTIRYALTQGKKVCRIGASQYHATGEPERKKDP